MRHTRLFLPLCLAGLALVACGGGDSDTSPDGVPVTGSALLTGQVLSIDGSSAALGGVVLALRETSTTACTDADGSFSFGAVPTGTLTLDVLSAPVALTAAKDGEGGADSEDGTVVMDQVRDRDQIHLRLHLQDCEVCAMDCTRTCEQTETQTMTQTRETEMTMERAGEGADPDMVGKLEMVQNEERERIRVRAENAEDHRVLELWAVDPDGGEELLGTRTAGAEGLANWVLDTGEGARLPFGLRSIEDLEGYTIEIRDGDTGDVLLTIEVPPLPPYGPDADGADGSGPAGT